MYNSFMNGYSPGYGTGYNQNNYGNYGMMQSQIPSQSIAQTSLQGMQTGQIKGRKGKDYEDFLF